MSKIDQGYKLMYIYILFLMFIHVYFILFFSENKARLSAKIRSKKWRNKIKGESFDNILYLSEVDIDSECPEGYEIYNNTQWQGTKEGIFFEKLTRPYPCSLVLNQHDEKFKNELIENTYTISSIFNPSLGGQNYYIEYSLKIPYFEHCDDNNMEEKCLCPEKLDTSDNFYNKYPDFNITKLKASKIDYEIIKERKPINLNIINHKKLCGKKVKDFLLIGNNEEKICNEKGGVLCGEDKICIINETHCPQYSNLTIFKIMEGKEKIENKLISSLDINYNDIICSVLDNNTYHFISDNLPEESKYPLNKSNDFAYKNKQQRCSPHTYKTENLEDIIFISSLPIQEYYNHTEIPQYYEELPYYESLIEKSKDRILLSATTYFRLNSSAKDICANDILRTVNESFQGVKIISQNKTKNFFFLDGIFVIIFLAILIGHISKLNVRTEPVMKFWSVKYLILFTLIFLVIYSMQLVTSENKKENINLDILVEKLDDIIEKKCFSNNVYNNYLKQLSKRLDEYNLLKKGIYTNILTENIFVIVIALGLTLSKISLKQLIFLKNENQY